MSNSLGKNTTHAFSSPKREHTKLQTIDTETLRFSLAFVHFFVFCFFLKKLHFVWPLPRFLVYQLIKSTSKRQYNRRIKNRFILYHLWLEGLRRQARLHALPSHTSLTGRLASSKSTGSQSFSWGPFLLWGFSRACSVTLEAGSLGETVWTLKFPGLTLARDS